LWWLENEDRNMDTPETKPATLAFRYDPSVREVFTDAVAMLSSDGSVVRLVLGATRSDPRPPSAENQPYMIPAARLVMTPQAAANLHAQLGQLLAALEKRGVVKSVRRSAIQPKPVIDHVPDAAAPARTGGEDAVLFERPGGKGNGQFRLND